MLNCFTLRESPKAVNHEETLSLSLFLSLKIKNKKKTNKSVTLTYKKCILKKKVLITKWSHSVEQSHFLQLDCDILQFRPRPGSPLHWSFSGSFAGVISGFLSRQIPSHKYHNNRASPPCEPSGVSSSSRPPRTSSHTWRS